MEDLVAHLLAEIAWLRATVDRLVASRADLPGPPVTGDGSAPDPRGPGRRPRRISHPEEEP